MDTQRRIISLEMPKDSSNYEKPTVFVDELEQTKTSIVQLYFERFKDWCRVQGFQDWALVATAILACIVSTILTIRLSIEMGQGQSVPLSFLFGTLWELSKYTFAWAGIAHPHKTIRAAAITTTILLIIGSTVASITWLAKSVEYQSKRGIAESIEYKDIKRQRDVIDVRIEHLSALAKADAEKGYRSRALTTDGKIATELKAYTELGKTQTLLLSEAMSPGAYLIPFAIAACMLEVIGVLALALWKFRDEEHEHESLEPDAVCVESECCEQAI